MSKTTCPFIIALFSLVASVLPALSQTVPNQSVQKPHGSNPAKNSCAVERLHLCGNVQFNQYPDDQYSAAMPGESSEELCITHVKITARMATIWLNNGAILIQK